MIKFLSICIPTYNRASFLQLCLSQFCKQIEIYKTEIELIVADNCSTDGTKEIVDEFSNKYSFIQYHQQAENLGADGNFAWCFNEAKGKYVWIFGDDDVLLDDKLKEIVAILTQNNPDILYVKGYGFAGNNYLAEMPTNKAIIAKQPLIHFTSNKKFIQQINYFTTFASGNIVNKNILPADFNSSLWTNTNLVQTNWIFEALLVGNKFILMNENVMAIKTNNTGGYKLFETFASHYDNILNYFIEQRKMPKSFKKIIQFNMLLTFFPQFIIQFRKEKDSKFIKESPQQIMNKVFKNNLWYYLFCYPVFLLPIGFAEMYCKKVLNNFNRLLNAFK